MQKNLCVTTSKREESKSSGNNMSDLFLCEVCLVFHPIKCLGMIASEKGWRPRSEYSNQILNVETNKFKCLNCSAKNLNDGIKFKGLV